MQYLRKKFGSKEKTDKPKEVDKDKGKEPQQKFTPEAFSQKKGQATKMERQRSDSEVELERELEALEREQGLEGVKEPVDPEMARLEEMAELEEQARREGLRKEFGGFSKTQLEKEYKRLGSEVEKLNQRAERDRVAFAMNSVKDAENLLKRQRDVDEMSESELDKNLSPQDMREIQEELRGLGTGQSGSSVDEVDLDELEKQVQIEDDRLPSEKERDRAYQKFERMNAYMTMQAEEHNQKVDKKMGFNM